MCVFWKTWKHYWMFQVKEPGVSVWGRFWLQDWIGEPDCLVSSFSAGPCYCIMYFPHSGTEVSEWGPRVSMILSVILGQLVTDNFMGVPALCPPFPFLQPLFLLPFFLDRAGIESIACLCQTWFSKSISLLSQFYLVSEKGPYTLQLQSDDLYDFNSSGITVFTCFACSWPCIDAWFHYCFLSSVRMDPWAWNQIWSQTKSKNQQRGFWSVAAQKVLLMSQCEEKGQSTRWW